MPPRTDVASLSMCHLHSSPYYWSSSWCPLTFVLPISTIYYDSPTDQTHTHTQYSIYNNILIKNTSILRLNKKFERESSLLCQTYSLIIVKIFLESFPRLCVNAFMCDVWIFFVSWTLIILATMCFPISKAHPAEIMFTVVTLHVITATILLYTDMTFWTLENNFTIKYFLWHFKPFVRILTSLVWALM